MTVLFVLACFGALVLHVFSLPANWVVLGLVALWKATHPDMALTWIGFGGLALLALAGEGLEFVIRLKGAKQYGASSKGNWGGVLGAIAGAIVGAGFLFGIGALPGALLGAFGGCLAVERIQGRTFEEARTAAMGAMYGTFLGLVAKVGIGVVMATMAAGSVWGA
nr:DUF456 domain-containing protein [Desulfobaculum xiamenense]